MNYDEVLEIVSNDKRTHRIPILYIVQILIVVLDYFGLEKKDELSLSEQLSTESNVTPTAGSH